MSQWKTFLHLSDTHCPHTPLDTWRWALDHITDRQPDYVVFGGDLLEATAASRFPHEEEHSLLDEYRFARARIRELLDAAPNAQHVFIEGNHDHNLRAPNRIPRDIRELLDYRNHIADLRHFRFIPYINNPDGCFYLGPVTFLHGFASGATSGVTEGIIHGVPYGLSVRGHTHRPKPVTQIRKSAALPLPYWYANSGTLGPLKPDYANRLNTSEWAAGITVGSARMGRRHYSRKQWEGELILREDPTGGSEPES